jgi:hypothetical protein
MTASRDPDRLIHAFLREGEDELQDQVYDAVRAEIEQKRQRAFIGPWRIPEMNRIVSIGLGAAAVVLALFVGAQLLGPPSGGFGGDAEATPSPEPTATLTPVATPSGTPEGLLPEGPHVLTDGDPLDGLPTLRLMVTIPGPDWHGAPGEGILVKDDNAAAPDGAGMIVFFGDLYVYGDPCDWAETRPETPATTVDELVAALTAQASRDATEPVDVTVDGYAGKSITLHVPDTWPTGAEAFADCDRGTFGSWGMEGSDPAPFRYHQDPGQIDTLYIVDVDGTLAVIDTAYYGGTPQSVIDELEAIVESASFD